MRVSRSWKWIDENAEISDAQVEEITPTLDALASEWSEMQTAIEQEGFRRQAEMEEGWDYGLECEEEKCTPKDPCADCKAAAKSKRQKKAAREVRIEIIEGMLQKYGARMMRPYEHWNEDERFMEYQERDRD